MPWAQLKILCNLRPVTSTTQKRVFHPGFSAGIPHPRTNLGLDQLSKQAHNRAMYVKWTRTAAIKITIGLATLKLIPDTLL